MFSNKHRIKFLNVFLALGLFGVGIGGVSSLAWAADTKIAFVNIQEAMFATKEYKRASASFKSDFDKEKGIIAARERKIKKMLDNLSKQGFVLSPELKKKKEDRFLKEKKGFERYVQDRNEEFSRNEKTATAKILRKMLKVLQKIGKDKRLTMIMEKKTVFYSDSATDLTKLATKTYDKMHK
ncbi:MAG: OmpH family outer membrane protein [Nitrospina sp.]|nr:MAG: OmpH family outer membrane protein [Nitrospina sp.]